LSQIEIARHLQKLKDTFNYSHRDLELKGFGSPASITNALKLLKLPVKIQDHIHEGKLTPAHCLPLLKLDEEEVQEAMAKRFIDHDLSASKAKGRVSNYLKKGETKQSKEGVEIPAAETPNVYFKDARDMSELPDESIHLVLTSPPYGIGMEYEKELTLKDIVTANCSVLEESCRVLVPGGVMAINVADLNNHKNEKGIREYILVGSGYQQVLRQHGVYLSDIIIWHKQKAWSKRNQLYNENTKHTSYRTMDNFEPVYVFRKEGDRQEPEADIAERSYLTKDQWKECVDGVWRINALNKQDGHPNQWPEELPTRLIQMFSFVGETVLDPFLGSGTTLKVAKDLNRNAVGYEIAEKYKQVIMKKLGIEDVPPAENEASEEGLAACAEEAPKAEVFSNDPALIKEFFEQQVPRKSTEASASEA